MKGDNAVQPRGDGHEIFVGRRVGPYEVQSHLGTGGMGSVFRARDTKLGRDVALKILPDRWLADPERRARFNREARVLAALNHPHIAAIYDLEDSDGIRALVLELVEGPTLAERLSEGPLPSTNALRMGAQVADALAAAHARGIIHRDLKPANIKLTADGRVKVLDFGLAKANAIMDNGPLDLSHPATVVRATQEGILLGTVGYMSPEQARGRMVDERTDIWAFGCVLYEMLTGRQAFEGDTFPDAVAAILTRDPDWARLPSALPAEVRALLHQCLEKEPDRRIRDISTVASQLTDSQKLPARQAPSKLVGIAVTILLVFLAGIYFRRAIIRGPVELARSTRSGPAAVLAPSLPAPKPRRAVAVLGFRNLSPRQGSAWVSDALAEMLTSELTAGEQLRMIPGETIARMKIDLELADAESYARETLDRIRVNLGTDLVVLGSYVTIGQRIRLDLRVQNTAEGAASIVVSETGSQGELLDLVSRTGESLRERLGIGQLSSTEAGQLQARLPTNSAAVRFYSEGLARLRLFDALKAKALLEKAVNADPELPLAHSALATVWSTLGYDERAALEARRAFDLSTRLGRADRLLVEGRYRELTNDRAKAVEIFKTLFTFFPDNLDYGLQLAAAQSASGDGKGALATIEALRRLPTAISEDPRLDLAEAAAARALTDLKRQRAAAERAASRSASHGARLLLANARLSECDVLSELGEPQNATAACEEARRIFAEAGDFTGVARALHSGAVVLRIRGDLDGALSLYRAALATFRKTGNKRATSVVNNNVANALRQQGDFAGARRMYGESLAIARELGDKSGAARALNNIGIVLRQQGDLGNALISYKEALAIRQAIGERRTAAETLGNIANVLSDQGDLAGAGKMYEEALATAREIGDKLNVAIALNNLAFVRSHLGDVERAQANYEESLASSRANHDERGVARALTNLAEVVSRRGNLAEARKMYEDALAIWRQVGEKRGLGYALSGLGDVLIAENDLPGSRTRFEEALAIRQQSGEHGTAAESRVALARLAIEDGRPHEAEVLAGEATATFATAKMVENEVIAQDVLTRSLLAQHRSREARRVSDRARLRSRRMQNVHVRLSSTITDARVRAAGGEIAQALEDGESAIVEARRVGFFDLQLEARLALGEIEVASGRTATGVRRLRELEKEANQQGFLLIAHKASAATAGRRE